MNYAFHFTVHVYAEEQLDDRVLIPHNKFYGIVGKDIIAPLRKINGKTITPIGFSPDTTIQFLWDWVDNLLYAQKSNIETLNFIQEYGIVEKYLVFNNLRYNIADSQKSLDYCLKKMNASEKDVINIQLLVSADAGTVFTDDGIRYYMNSKEAGKHNVPHVHVDIRHEASGAFSLIDGTQLTDGKIKNKDKTSIKKMISDNQFKLLKYWNDHTDGLTVDLNQALGLIPY